MMTSTIPDYLLAGSESDSDSCDTDAEFVMAEANTEEAVDVAAMLDEAQRESPAREAVEGTSLETDAEWMTKSQFAQVFKLLLSLSHSHMTMSHRHYVCAGLFSGCFP